AVGVDVVAAPVVDGGGDRVGVAGLVDRRAGEQVGAVEAGRRRRVAGGAGRVPGPLGGGRGGPGGQPQRGGAPRPAVGGRGGGAVGPGPGAPPRGGGGAAGGSGGTRAMGGAIGSWGGAGVPVRVSSQSHSVPTGG